MINAEGVARYEQSSPLLLTLENSTALTDIRDPGQESEEWNQLRSKLESRLMMCRSWRYSWLEHWCLIAQYLNPRRSLWLSQGGVDQPVPNSMSRGQPINQAILDPTATYAMQVCAAGLMSGLMSPSRPWFKLRPGVRNFQLDREAKLWFEEVEDRVYTVMAESNFYTTGAQMFEDLVGFGTAVMLIYEDDEEIISCYGPVVGEYYILIGPSFRPEGLFRQYVLTVSQMVEEFGLENCPMDVQQMWQQKGAALETERIIAHSIEPNAEIKPDKDRKGYGKVKGDYTFREVFWVWGVASDKPLSMRGFKDLPFIAPRWFVNGNDPYGRSPAMTALGDIMQLQQETRRKAELLEKLVRPPLKGPLDLKNQPSSLLPGHVTFSQSPDKFTPLFEVPAQAIAAITADLKEIQQRIRTGFFNDLFLMIAADEKTGRTAYEIAVKQQEKLQILGPVIERFQNEGASPAIRRILSILNRKKLLPPMPRSLIGVPIEIQYISILAMAQKAVATAIPERLVQLVNALEPLYPGAKDNLNPDQIIRDYNEALAGSQNNLTDEEQMKKDREARAKQEAAAAQAMQEKQLVDQSIPAIAKSAKDLGSIDLGGGAAAGQLASGGPFGGFGGGEAPPQ